MTQLMKTFVVAATLLAVSRGQQTCSTACEQEFQKCVCYKVSVKNLSVDAAKMACESEIRTQSGPITNFCFDPNCSLTSKMQSATCVGATGVGPVNSPGGGGGVGSGGICGASTNEPSEKPSAPTLVTEFNQGRCPQPSPGFLEYTFWSNGQQRCVNAYIPTSLAALPVVLQMECYTCDRHPSSSSPKIQGAEAYGYAMLTLSTPNSNWAFGNDGVVNDANPLPCASTDSGDIPYLKAVFDLVESHNMLDSGRVYTSGFSQNSMFAAYAAFCFQDRVAGVWQGGSGMVITGSLPIPPRKEGFCKASDFDLFGHSCDQVAPCTDCQYWPVKPVKTTERPMVDCIQIYTNDFLYGTDGYMADEATKQGHDIRHLIFSPTQNIQGGHKGPLQEVDWMVGCLGVTSACGVACETEFVECMASTNSDFTSCLTSTSACVDENDRICAPTLTMLKQSENPQVTLSHGKFGGPEPATPTPTPTLLQGGFDWGEGCDAGGGEFSMQLPNEGMHTDVGVIPSGKWSVRIELESDQDIDITIYDVKDTSSYPEGQAIVQWCAGVCNTGVLGMNSRYNEAIYSRSGVGSMFVKYSGYNGVDGKKGHEFIEIEGEVTTDLMMKAYAYKQGSAEVRYAWSRAQTGCCQGTQKCKGSFEQQILLNSVVAVGEIPVGKKDVRISLISEQDVDIQLFDLDDTTKYAEGQAIIAWCVDPCNTGYLNGPNTASIMYPQSPTPQTFSLSPSRLYTWSGFNGVAGQLGHEYIEIQGITSKRLQMKAFGYSAGYAKVEYEYWEPQTQN